MRTLVSASAGLCLGISSSQLWAHSTTGWWLFLASVALLALLVVL